MHMEFDPAMEAIIEDLDEDIAYLIYKIQREAKNA